MPGFVLHAPGRWGEKSAKDYSYSMVMETGGRVEFSGQGGWNPETLEFPAGVDLQTEVNQAFDNVTFMLEAVGLGWANVAHINSYDVLEATGNILVATAEMALQFRRRMPDHKPIWTCLGVAGPGDPRMRVEIRVTAYRD